MRANLHRLIMEDRILLLLFGRTNAVLCEAVALDGVWVNGRQSDRFMQARPPCSTWIEIE
jgi:hypothetical protein